MVVPILKPSHGFKRIPVAIPYPQTKNQWVPQTMAIFHSKTHITWVPQGFLSRVPRLRVPAFATEGVATAAIEAQQTAPRDITMTKKRWEPKLPKTNRS